MAWWQWSPAHTRPAAAAFNLEANSHELGNLVRHTGKLPQRKRERAV